MSAQPDPESPPEPSRRERRKLEVRGRIVEAAHELFEERGVAATRVSDICERADVAEKTFFNHFASRQHLMLALAETAVEDLLANVEEARRKPGPSSDQLAHLFGIFAENAERAGPMQRELVTEIIHTTHSSLDEADLARRLHEAFGALVRDGVERGDVSDAHDPDTLTELVLGSFYSLMFSWSNFEGYPLAERARAAARLLGDALSPRPRI
jgi:AcrR family transcriptional regulator